MRKTHARVSFLSHAAAVCALLMGSACSTFDTENPKEAEEPEAKDAREADLKDWQSALLREHNETRADEDAGLPALNWNPKLAAFAQAWADKLKSDTRCGLAHRSGSQRSLEGDVTGENLFAGGVSIGQAAQDFDAAFVVDSWKSEKENYDFAAHVCRSGHTCGHYTQLVWKATRELGCGRARCGGAEVWVCNYLPAGNDAGRTPY